MTQTGSSITLLEGDVGELLDSCWDRKTVDVELKEINDFVNEESEILLKELELSDKREELLETRIKELEARVRELEKDIATQHRQIPSSSPAASNNQSLHHDTLLFSAPKSLLLDLNNIEMPRATTPSV